MCGRSCVLLLDFHATVVTSTFLFLLFNDTAATEIISVLTHSFPTRRSSDLLRARPVLWRLYDELDRGPVDRRLQMPRPARRRLRPARDGVRDRGALVRRMRSEEHTSELQSLMRRSYAFFCLKNKTQAPTIIQEHHTTAKIKPGSTSYRE